MADSDFTNRFVVLKGGMVIPAPAYVLLLDLETRGFTLAMDGSTLVVSPPDQLTREDCSRLRRWKWFIAMLMDYCKRPRLDEHLFTDIRPANAVIEHGRPA